MMLNNSLKKFWLKKASILEWKQYPKIAYVENNFGHKWYCDGKINLYKNLISNNLIFNKNKIAIYTLDKKHIFKSYTYYQIDRLVNNFIFFFLKKKKINRVMIHASASIETAVAMLACIKRGIFFSVIFEDLEEEAIKKRINLFLPNIFITKSKKFYDKFNKLHHNKIKIINLNEFNKIKIKNVLFTSKVLNSNNNFFCLFTSGSTGSPKGVIHSYGGYSVYAKYTCKNNFGFNNNSIVLTASDAGWINGHTYSLFGPLFFGATTILLETPMLMLNENNIKRITKIGTTVLYLPVTIIRLMKSILGNKKFKKNKIITLGSMGEPLAPTIADWFANVFDRKNYAIVNTYFQTETGGIIASPKFNESSQESPNGSVGKLTTCYLTTKKLKEDIKKEFILTKPWPGCMTGILGDKKQWKKYWDKENNFRMFDLATKYKNNIYIHGRTDDVINIRGHRIGSEELESVVLNNKNIIECCAVSVDDTLEGKVFYLYVVLKKKIDYQNINKLIKSNFGSFAIPKHIITLPQLPKTRSGKILRRLLRILSDQSKDLKKLGDLSTILNPEIISIIKKELYAIKNI
jgi:acetyl-CoA synthetase